MMVCYQLTVQLNWFVEINAEETLNINIVSVCNLVEEVETVLRITDLQSKNNDAEEGDRRRAPEDGQSHPENEPRDQDDEDSSGEDDDDEESQDQYITLQPVRRSKRKSERYASKMDGKSSSLEPKRSTRNARKKSKPHVVADTEASSARPVSCPICHKQFKGLSAKGNRNRHLQLHAPEPKFPCPHCPAMFKQKRYRQSHIKTIHLKVKPVKVKKFPCQFCAKKFATPYDKKEHEMVSNIARS
jgi:hypothetical protein